MATLPISEPRHDWTDAEVQAVHDLPLPELLFRAQEVHRAAFDPTKVQLCTLLSIKTGGCPEDCGYCPQSAHYRTGVEAHKLLELEAVVAAAAEARRNGASRFCMGAAWREVKDGPQLERVLEMVRGVAALGLEVCCTLGMLTEAQAERLAAAGLTAYNHNLDSGPDFYSRIITTRTYDDRLQTLAAVRRAGLTVCCGGILGMGETVADRVAMLTVLAHLDPHPESVPINALVAVEGTPLADRPPVSALEMARMIATARIVLPRSRVRLSAGRATMSEEAQALCLLAGANSLFLGERLLTTPNPGPDADAELLAKLGLEPLPAPGLA
ncbi:MAG TPA: biotin synthase BioB [Thermoanaerobaculia bacterium]|jgi:biotin synthase|nr:biotin synthase BioB [Thermoanaerobaculia bacterium]